MIKRIRAARHYQRADDQVCALATRACPAIAKGLREALQWLSDSVDVSKIKHVLEHGNDPAATIDWHHFREVLKAPFGKLAQLYTAAAQLGARKINGSFNAAGRSVRYRKTAFGAVAKDIVDQYAFDTLSPETQQKLRDAQDALIVELEDGARDAIEQIITDGVRTGASVDEMADSIRSFISLTDTQAQAALNCQAMLYNLDPAALERRLRNTDFDDTLLDAIDSGEDLNDATVSSMVEDYVSNYLDYRALSIAQTESTNAANRGLHDSYAQAIDRGVFPPDAVRRFWQLADHPCPICESIPDMNPDGVAVGDDFDSIEGPIDDPAVHPNCFCSVTYITDLTKVPDDGEAEAA